MSKARRRKAILDLLQQGPVPSQEDIADALRAAIGETVNQSTISRDLRELGVVKRPEGYCLPGGGPQPRAGTSALASTLRTHAVGIETAGSLVVVRGGPGRGALIGAAVDDSGAPEVVGTVAGDDTIFVATRSPEDAKRLTEKLRELAGFSGS